MKHLRDNLARFFYDVGRVSLTVLVISVIAQRSFQWADVCFGGLFTLTFLVHGVILDLLLVED